MRRPLRKNYLINKRMQLGYAIFVVAILLIYTVVLLAAIFVPTARMMTSDTLAVRAEAAGAFLALHNTAWPWIGTAVVLFAVMSVILTHKLAGPLFVIKRMLGSVASGDLTARVRLRKYDELHELAGTMNEMTGKLEALLSALDDRFKNLASHAQSIAPEHAREDRAKIVSETEAIRKLLEQYKFAKKPND